MVGKRDIWYVNIIYNPSWSSPTWNSNKKGSVLLGRQSTPPWSSNMITLKLQSWSFFSKCLPCYPCHFLGWIYHCPPNLELIVIDYCLILKLRWVFCEFNVKFIFPFFSPNASLSELLLHPRTKIIQLTNKKKRGRFQSDFSTPPQLFGVPVQLPHMSWSVVFVSPTWVEKQQKYWWKMHHFHRLLLWYGQGWQVGWFWGRWLFGALMSWLKLGQGALNQDICWVGCAHQEGDLQCRSHNASQLNTQNLP